MRIIYLILFIFLISCENKNPYDLGLINKLPKGTYIIYNTGSRHIVKCIREDDKFYWLNDAHFGINNIPGYDAHQYLNKTLIKIK